MSLVDHNVLTDANLHVAGYVRNTDPRTAGLSCPRGMLWFDPDTNRLHVSTGSAWTSTPFGEVGGIPVVLTSIADGDVIVYSSARTRFENISADVAAIAGLITNVTTLQGQVTTLMASVAALESSLSGAAVVPTGTIAAFAMTSAPAGWLECNGAAVSRSTYATLFGKVSTTFGAGNGTTTFNLPDLRGVFLRGWDHGKGVDTGRSFGTVQPGTLIAADNNLDDGNILSLGGAVPSAGKIQSDTPVFSDYPSAWYQWVIGGGDAGELVTTGTPSTGVVRPRNVALLFCIKL